MGRWAGLVAALAAAACQFPSPTDVLPDAPPVDGPVDARPDLVTGTVSIGYRTEAGVTERYTDLSSVAIAALVPDAAEPSGFRTIVGTGTADGRFTIEGVPPEGEYYLKVGTTYFWTAAHVVNIRPEAPARPDTQTATAATIIRGPAPLTPGGLPLYDTELISLRAGVRFEFARRLSAPATLEGDWARTSYGLYEPNRHILPAASSQDDLWWLLYRRRLGSGLEERDLVGARLLAKSTISDGQPRDLVDVVEPVAATHPVDVSFGSLLAYDAGYDYRSEAGVARLSVHAVPALAARWLTQGWNAYGAPVVEVSLEVSAASRVVPAVRRAVADPFSTDWPRLLAQRYERRYWYRAPGDPSPVSFEGGLFRVAPLPLSGSLTSQLLAPPTAITIAGADGASGGGIRATGGAIDVAWRASAGARQYAVSVLRLNATGLRLGPTVVSA